MLQGLLKRSAILPVAFVVMNFLWIIPAIVKSDFWGDDFINLTFYDHRYTPLLQSDGKITINLFWGTLSFIFGSNSAIPYLLLNSFVALCGSYVFALVYEKKFPNSPLNPIWIIATLLNSTVLIPIMLWTSNIVHSISLLAIACGLFLNLGYNGERKSSNKLLFLESLCWITLIVSNPLYLSCIIFPAAGIYQNYKSNKKSQFIKQETFLRIIGCILIPTAYFVFFAYPLTTSKSAYSNNSINNISVNLDFYFSFLTNKFVSGFAVGIFLALSQLILTIIFLVRKDKFGLVSVIAISGIVLPILMQGQQKGIHYFAVPICLAILCWGQATQGMNVENISWRIITFPTVLILSVCLLLQSQNVRTWFMESPYGSPLTNFRNDLAKEVDKDSSLCISSALTSAEWDRFLGGIAFERGFRVPPISNSKVTLDEMGLCAKKSDIHFQVILNSRGEYSPEKLEN